ncbi:MAG: hypothetical protein ACLFUJ_15655, partial [Phycisphaerae bacterium]
PTWLACGQATAPLRTGHSMSGTVGCVQGVPWAAQRSGATTPNQPEWDTLGDRFECEIAVWSGMHGPEFATSVDGWQASLHLGAYAKGQ